MRQIIRFKATRSICYVLIAALVFTFTPAPVAQKAHAQLMPTYVVAVVDFVNESGVQGELLARLATDAVVVEMSKTNRYDVSITRSQIESEMKKLDLHAPLSKVGVVRLGESLSTDAMLQGVVKSVKLSGSGATRSAAVTLVVQMIDQASGEVINGAIQTGKSSPRVGYTPDDDSLITEAINNAAFLVVKTMVDYIIPEATVQANIGADQVMLSKGARDGIKPGMRMIVLRQKEIIGYVQVRSVDPIDSIAKVTKSMRGIRPEDKVRAIFEMPTVSPTLAADPQLGGAPSASRGGKGALGKIGKFVLGAAIVFGLASLFSSSGREDADSPGALSVKDGIPGLTWDSSQYDHGNSVVQLQILRDPIGGINPVKVIQDISGWELGKTQLVGIYGTGLDTQVAYYTIDAPGESSFSETSYTVPAEEFGQQHAYAYRVLYRLESGGEEEDSTYLYYFSELSSQVLLTAIERVMNSDVVWPFYDPNSEPPEVFVTDLQQGLVNFQWNRKDGADEYQVRLEPVIAGTGPTWQSSIIHETGPIVELSDSDRLTLASLLNNSAYVDNVMMWQVLCRNSTDTPSSEPWPAWGDENRFRIGSVPPGP